MDSLTDVEFVNSVDARLANADMRFGNCKYDLPIGASSVTYKNLASTGSSIASGTSYNINLSQNQLIDNYLVEEMTIQVTVNATNNTAGAVAPLQLGCIAPGFMPLAMSSSLIQVTLNGEAFSLQPNNMLDKLMAFNKTPELSGADLSKSATALDTFATYSLPTAPEFASQAGTIKSAFGDYSQATYGNSGRLAQVDIVSIDVTTIAQGAQATRVFSFTVREPLFNQTTAFSSETSRAWIGLTNLQIQRSFLNNVVPTLIKYINPVAGVGGNPSLLVINSIVAEIVNTPTLYYSVITMPASMPAPVSRKYDLIDYMPLFQSNGFASGVKGSTTTVTSPAIPLSYVPKCIYVWAGLDSNSVAFGKSDAPGSYLTQLTLEYVTSGQFAGQSYPQLYDAFCARAGFVKEFQETKFLSYLTPNTAVLSPATLPGGYGSVFRIDATDLTGIDWSMFSVGSPYQQNLQITATVNNLRETADAVNLRLYILVVNQGYYELAPNQCIRKLGIATQDVVQKCRADAPTIYEHVPRLGAGFWGDVWSGIKKAGKWAWDNKAGIAKVVGKVAGLGRRGQNKRAKSGRRGKGDSSERNLHCDCDINSEECDTCSPSLKGGNLLSAGMVSKEISTQNRAHRLNF